MLNFTEVKRNQKEFLALTGLTLKEFKLLLPAFSLAYSRRYEGDQTRAGTRRKRQWGGGRRSRLDAIEQKLLFILVYQKTYPLQVVIGQLFEMDQSAANQWIHRLWPVLQEALTALGVMPERDGPKFAAAQRQHAEPPDYIIDGTERRRHRPKDPEKQALHYSGKQKLHTDKNIVITQTQTKRVGFLSPTRPGTVHDKKLADHEHIAYPRQSILHKDTAFQGDEPEVRQTPQPKKKPRGHELTKGQKRHNRKLARVRVRVEPAICGIKRSRCVKDTLRNTGESWSDDFMATASALHNLRVAQRKRALRR